MERCDGVSYELQLQWEETTGRERDMLNTHRILQIVLAVGRVHGEDLLPEHGVVHLGDGVGVLGHGGDVDGPLGPRARLLLFSWTTSSVHFVGLEMDG